MLINFNNFTENSYMKSSKIETIIPNKCVLLSSTQNCTFQRKNSYHSIHYSRKSGLASTHHSSCKKLQIKSSLVSQHSKNNIQSNKANYEHRNTSIFEELLPSIGKATMIPKQSKQKSQYICQKNVQEISYNKLRQRSNFMANLVKQSRRSNNKVDDISIIHLQQQDIEPIFIKNNNFGTKIMSKQIKRHIFKAPNIKKTFKKIRQIIKLPQRQKATTQSYQEYEFKYLNGWINQRKQQNQSFFQF